MNILRLLLLSTTLCLVPLVSLCQSSSTTLTSDSNPIVLPTTSHYNFDDDGDDYDDDDDEYVVLDMEGKPLKIEEEYTIVSTLTGGGNVYLADVGNTKCPNAVAAYNSGNFGSGTPVKFVTIEHELSGDTVKENVDINIMFSTSTSKLCVNETVWKVGDYFLGPPQPRPRFVVTGGNLRFPGPETIKNWFKIEKYVMENQRPNVYKLRYCPSKLMCIGCDHFDCAYIGLTVDSGITRLALNNKPYPFAFKKVNNTN